MRNLKKVLSLVLCLAVMLSVMVVGAGAAFSDQDKIENTEAVDACSALNIINGYEDGAFHPERNIKRAEVTKMICVALNGGNEPNVSTNAKPTFTDVRGTIYAWAEGYIESCYAQGIVDGVNGNRFAPASNVTAAQLAKMLLVSLGYNAKTEQFTGNAWETNVNVRASQKHLYDGLEKMDTSAPVTRDQAAQMVWNAMQAYEVEYKDGVVQDKVVGSTNDKITLLRDRYDAWVYVGTLTEVDSTNITITMNAADRDASDPKPNSDVTSKSFSKIGQDYSSLLGQKVKVLFKDGKSNDVIGIYATSDNTVYKTLMNAVELDGNKIKFNGTSYSVDNTKKIATTFVGIDGTETKDQAIGYFDSTANNSANKTSLNEVTFVDSDANNKIDTAIVTEKVPGEVTNVSSDKITFNGTTYKSADENIDKNIEQDDWAVMSANLYKDCKDIVKATVVTNTITGYKDKTADGYHQYKIADTWYNLTQEVFADAGVSTGDTVKAYVYNGVIVKMETDDGNGSFPANIAVAVGVSSTGTGNSLNGDQVRVRYFDGTVKTLTMSDKSVSPVQGVAYKISGTDTNAKLETLTPSKEYNGYKATLVTGNIAATPGTNDKIGSNKVDDNAAIILYTEAGRSKLITGKQFNALADSDVVNATAVFEKKTNGLNRVLMAAVKVNNINVSGNSSDYYAYIVSTAYENNGDLYYTIWDGKKNIDVVEEGNYSTDNRSKGMLIGYSNIDDNKKISDVTEYGTVDKDVLGNNNKNTTDVVPSLKMDDKTLYRGGNESTATNMISIANMKFNVTADTTVLRVDSDAEKDADIGQEFTYGTTTMTKAQKKANGDYTYNVFFVLDEKASQAGEDDLDIAVLVIDSTGAFKGHKIDNPVAPPEKPDAGKEYKTADELKAALKAGDVTATGLVPAGTYVSDKVLTLNDAVLDGTVTTTCDVVLNGKTQFVETGALHVNGTLTINKDASVDLNKVQATKVVDNRTQTTAADVDLMFGTVKASDVTVEKVDGALTTTDLSGKALTVKTGDVDLSNVTTSDAATKVKVAGTATLSATPNLSGTWDVAKLGGVTSLTVSNGTTTIDKVGTVTDVKAGATLNIKDATATVTTVTNNNGTLNIDGNVTTITDNNGSLTVGKDVATVTNVTKGTVTIGGNLTTFTKMTGGTLNLNGTATITNGTTLSAGTISLGAKAKVTINATSGVDVSSVTLKGVDGAAIVVENAADTTAEVTVKANTFFAKAGTDLGAKLGNDKDDTYTWDGTLNSKAGGFKGTK